MNIDGRSVLVTGAARGIGRELARQAASAGARVVAVDREAEELAALAGELGDEHLVQSCDVADRTAFGTALEEIVARIGSLDVCICNAGIADGGDPVDTPPEVWERMYAVNVEAHVTAARALLPGWLSRGEGYFVSVASAAGLLTQIGSAPYSVTKHAAVAFAEWLSVTYGDRGLRVSCACPMGVDTRMLSPGAEGALEAVGSRVVRGAGSVLGADEVAAAILAGIEEERFLVLPHPEVLDYFQHKAHDYDRWLGGMRRLQATAGRGA
ncbi:MAG TPA: SDR family oxidoreductase [Solirubrobacterales bacterium]|nr:SDR family oxidoreductase [Solirubrobacterales bacterium]